MLKCIMAMKTQKLLNIFDVKIMEKQHLVSWISMKYAISLDFAMFVII